MSAPLDKVEALFHEALKIPPADRPTFLAEACRSDAALGGQVEELLKAEADAGRFLPESPQQAVRHKLDLPEDNPDEAVGQMLGRYKLLERVGEGGCGVVYVAEQTDPVRRRVALKVIKLGMDTKSVVARFEAERQALAMMDHPNIAKVLDAGTTDVGRPYFVMELVRGIRITDYCDQAQLSTRDRLELFIKVCQAIQHAHQKGIIHRDIKPSNILVTLNDGVAVPKVIDFGIAKATEGRLTDDTVYTRLHQFIGTPAYMSPEQAEMTSLDIDTRSDIYSLGVLLYELLAGSTPFDASELMSQGVDAMRKTIREKEPRRPSTQLATLGADDLTTRAKRRAADTSKLLHQLKGDLDWIVMKCLEKDRQRRYETANGLATDLRRHLNNEPVTARPPTTAYRLQKAFRRNKLAFTAATAVAVALLAGFGISSWQTVVARKAEREAEQARRGEHQQRLEAQTRQSEAEAERRRAETERQRADAETRKTSISQEQSRRLLYVSDMNLAQHSLRENNLGRARRLLDRHRPQPGEEDLRGWEWRYLWQRTRSGALVTLTNRPARGFDVSFSGDGRHLAVGWYDGRVDLWDVPGRRLLRPLVDREQPHKAQVAFSPRRNLLLATSQPMLVTLYDLDSGRESVLWRAPEGEVWEVRDLSFSQDGSKAIIYAGSIDGDGDAVWVVDVAARKIEGRHSTTAGRSVYSGAAQLSPDNRRLYLSRSRNIGYICSIQCLDLTTGTPLWETETQSEFAITTLAVSPDGKMLATGSGFVEPTIRVWDAATGQLRSRLEGHTGWVAKLVFSKDGKKLLSAASDQTIRFWETGQWTETGVLRGHTDEIHSLAISDSAQLIASTGKDGNLMLWRADGMALTDGYRVLPPGLSKRGVMPLDHGRVLLLPNGRSPELLDLRPNVPPTPLNEIEPSRELLGWLPGGILCQWTVDNQIVVLEWRGGEFIQLGSIKLDSGQPPTGVVYNPSQHLLAWTEEASPTSVLSAGLTTPGRRVELRSDVRGLVPFGFSEDGSHLVAVTRKFFSQRLDPIRAWNIRTGKIVISIDEPVLSATLAGGGKVLVATYQKGSDHEIAFHDLTHPALPPRRVAGRFSSEMLAASPDERLVASTTGGGLVRLFDPLKGELVANLQGHLNAALGVAFSPDGRRLISSYGGREAIKLWDVDTHQELLTLSGSSNGQLYSALWSSDGEAILAEQPWQTWRAPSWDEIAAAEAKDQQP